MFASLLTGALAFQGPMLAGRSPRGAVRMVTEDDLSAAIPFVAKPKNLNGELLCDIGFDPAGFTNKASPEKIAKFREAELKHGRVCMLAVLGFVAQELIAPYQAAPFNEVNPINAIAAVPALGILQIIVLCGIIENRTQGYAGRIPGDIGFDPLGLSAGGIKEDWAIAEIKHGRLAMIAFLAFQVQIKVSGESVLSTTFDIFSP
ncbi:hypothetical protein KFE25_013576 [Diacronema lutheri]|uniref:Uncharacterized protein n=1 Tax=Diacronema lutheri TaxID=2081491 RepID=A0A8J5XNK9_DIALT|nr:hypothetical protein KFE25_013576 [Diacronema lutheri]